MREWIVFKAILPLSQELFRRPRGGWLAFEIQQIGHGLLGNGWNGVLAFDKRKFRHRYLLPVVSRTVPEFALRFLNKRWPVGYDPADGWTFWLDASYDRYVRKDKRRKGVTP